MWGLIPDEAFERALKRVERKHRDEVVAVMNNLDTYLKAASNGVRPMQLVKLSFVHNEGKDVHAIDQSPEKAGVCELRLYVVPDEKERAIHLITIGDKGSQGRDVKKAHDYVKVLRRRK